MSPPRWRADAALAFVSLIWGSTFVLVKNALEDISTNLFLSIRFSVAAVALALLWFAKRDPKARVSWQAGAVTGAFLYGGYLLQTLGLRYTSPSKSGFITGLYIVLVPLLSAAVYKKAPVAAEWIGVASAGVGLGLLTLDTARFELGPGDLLTIGCAFAFAAHILVLGHFARQTDADGLAMTQIGAGAAIGIGTFWWLETPYVRWSFAVIAALAVTSLLATALAFWLQTWGQKYTSPTRAALIFSLEPVFAWLTAFVMAGERLNAQALAGAGCILAGILLVELKPRTGSLHPSP